MLLNLSQKQRFIGPTIGGGSTFAKADVLGQAVKIVNSEQDFPTPVGGVSTLNPLVDGITCWIIGQSVVLTSFTLKIEPGQIVAIIGYDSACSVLTTILAAPTIDITGATLTTQWLTWNNLGDQPIVFSGPDVFGSAVFAHRLVINNCDTVTDMEDSRNCGFTECRIIESSSGCYVYRGDQAGVQAQDNLVDGTAVGPFMDLTNSIVTTAVTIDTIFLEPEFTGDFIVGLPDNGNLDTDVYATVTGCNTLSSGSQTSGVSRDDTRWLFLGNDGIPDSLSEGRLFFSLNALPTTFGMVGATTIVQAVYNEGVLSQFTSNAPGGDLTCEAEIVRQGTVSVSGVIYKPAGGGANKYNIEVFANDVSQGGLLGVQLRADAVPFAFQVPATKEKDTDFDVRVTAVDSTSSVIVTSMNFSVR